MVGDTAAAPSPRPQGTGCKGHPEVVAVVILELIAGPALNLLSGHSCALLPEESRQRKAKLFDGGYCILPRCPL